jgi:uncharacterized lipoprotein YddW (UPF0748 family)
VRGSFRKACWVHLQGRDARSDVERIARLGFEEVLPNVVAVGGPLYPSRVRPQHPQAGGRDLVGEFVKEAKRRGLRVHAWIVSLCYPNPAFESSHRDWYVVNRLGVSCVDEPPYVPYYKWLCPSRPEVRGNLAELFWKWLTGTRWTACTSTTSGSPTLCCPKPSGGSTRACRSRTW